MKADFRLRMRRRMKSKFKMIKTMERIRKISTV